MERSVDAGGGAAINEQTAVQAFIDGSGFPLEYAAAAELKTTGFLPHHGRTFEDTNAAGATVYRDIDVLADLIDTRLAMPLQVVVECKHSTAPWIVLGGEMDSAPAIAAITTSLAGLDTSSGPRFVRGALEIAPPLDFALVTLRTKESGAAKESQAKGQPATDPAFDAVRQLVSAATGAARAIDELGDRVVVFPILLVDGSLWRYRYGEPVDRIDRARLVWWGAPGPDATVVDVVTRAAFAKDYLLELRERLVILAQAVDSFPVNPTVA